MKQITTTIIVAVALIGGISSCRHTVDYTQFPETKFSTDVSPILIANCTQDGCHGSNDQKRFSLLTYDDVMKNGEIKAGAPHSSNLYGVISTLNKNNIMPQPPSAPLTDEQIKTIYLWIAQGAKDN